MGWLGQRTALSTACTRVGGTSPQKPGRLSTTGSTSVDVYLRVALSGCGQRAGRVVGLCHGSSVIDDDSAADPADTYTDTDADTDIDSQAGGTGGPKGANTSRPGAASRRLRRGTAVLWRDRNTVQLERGSHRVVLDPLDTNSVRALMSGRPHGTSAAGGRRLHEQLGALGFLDDDPAPPLGKVVIDIAGRSRFAAVLGSALAASGVGTVRSIATGEANADHACPGGLLPSDEGQEFSSSFDAAVSRAVDARTRSTKSQHTSRSTRNRGRSGAARPHSGALRPDILVLTEYGPIEPAIRNALHVDGQAHLVVSVDEEHAVIGPLVVPGDSSCLRCLDLHRCDRDPAWPLLAVQLSTARHRRSRADLAMSLATAGVATSQLLTHLRGRPPATMSATLEWHSPDWRLRRRPWPPHPQCDCGASARSAHARHNEAVIVQ